MADAAEQIAQAEAYKQEGNTRFKEQNFRGALGSYHKVFCYINGLQLPGERSQASQYAEMMGRSATAFNVPDEKVEEVKKLKQSTNLNMAACYLKLGEHRKCIESCTKALSTCPLSKAYFRRGQAHLELRNLDEAKEDFEQARALEPQDPAVEKELKRLKQAFSQHDAKEKKRFAKLFSKMKEETDTAGTEADKDAKEEAGTTV
ncbi:Peptidyl-prolyl cis-trans isomerase FKBP4 [Symbiodinium microadriaticum]|uniref:peptidylprolyl isomerase n=1 Tax=Symbiodinium microadriaticum TaxID=2951 RepID=A0A1Q9DKE6_SYMMI|nr:Peptidyl-prolyl cis-trans isomerase FKBP4 [Symbiodinium microadriaticum]